MSIVEARYYYANGKLITLKTEVLQRVLQLLDGKIYNLETVIKTQDVSPEIRTDLREYQSMNNEIKRLLESRTNKVI